VHVRQRSCSRKCPSSASSIGGKPLRSQAWRRLITTAVRSARKRAIFGGRRALRSDLYMAALAAARYNPILSRFYQRLRAKGKPYQLALTAVMRKLLLALNHTLKPLPCTT
jgi:transposase